MERRIFIQKDKPFRAAEGDQWQDNTDPENPLFYICHKGGRNAQWTQILSLNQEVSEGLSDLTDPDDDRILFWDDSEGKFDWLDVSGVSITDTTLSGIGGSVGSTDNGIPRADGTGGYTLQGSTNAVITDNGVLVLGTTDATGSGGGHTPNLESHTSGNSTGDGTSIAAFHYSSTAAFAPIVVLARSKSATLLTHADVAVNDYLGEIVFQGSEGGVFRQGAKIAAYVETVAAGQVNAKLGLFHSSTEKLRVQDSGVVFPDFTTGAGFVLGSTNIDEYIQDVVGAMVTGNTETNITVTYQDADGTLDFVATGDITDGGTLSTGLTFPNTGLHILDTDASHDLIIKPGSNLTTTDKTLTLTTGDNDRTLDISAADVTISSFMAGVLDDTSEATFKATVNLEAGTDFHAYTANGNTILTDAGVLALANFNTNGILAQTAADTFAGRTITGTANEVDVSNGDGVSGNPTIGLPSDVSITTSLTVPNTGLHILDSDASHDLIIVPGSNLTNDRNLTITTGDANRILTLSGDTTLGGGTHSGTNTGDVTLAGTPDYITISGQVITRGQIDLAADVTGTLPVANGGTGMTETVAVLAYNSADDTNQTGNGADAAIPFDTEVFDTGSDFSSNTFTAPADGKYLVTYAVELKNITAAADNARVRLITSNRTYTQFRSSVNDLDDTQNFTFSVLADMDSGDTATWDCRISGEAGNTCSITGSGAMQTCCSVLRVA